MLARDKQLHLVAGFVIGAAVTGLSSFIAEQYCWAVGLFVAALVGVGKEAIYDKMMKKGTPEIMDALLTLVGGAAGALLFYQFFIA